MSLRTVEIGSGYKDYGQEISTITKLDKKKHLVFESASSLLKFYYPKKEKFEEIQKEDLYIYDDELNFRFYVDIYQGNENLELRVQNKYSIYFDEGVYTHYNEVDFVLAFNHDERLFYVICNDDEEEYAVYEIILTFSAIFNFIRDKMEENDFSEQDIKLASLMIDDFFHPVLPFMHELESDGTVKVLFSDGEREVKKSKLYELNSDYIVNVIENLQENEDEKITTFSELTFREFKKCFSVKFRSNNHSSYFLLHKITSPFFSKAATKFVKLIYKNNFLNEQEICLKMFNYL